MEVRKVKKEDIPAITSIHLDAFKGFFLTSLGESFLNRYYSFSLKTEESITFCAVDEKKNIIGFCFGTELSKGFHKRLVKNNFTSFLLIGLRVLFSRPNALFRLLFNMEKKASKNDTGDYTELLSIAVSKNASKMGIGKTLLKAFENEAKSRKCERIVLTTDLYENNSVIAFYQAMGYKELSVFTAFPNRKMLKLSKNL